jgi:hypothetical protein
VQLNLAAAASRAAALADNGKNHAVAEVENLLDLNLKILEGAHPLSIMLRITAAPW